MRCFKVDFWWSDCCPELELSCTPPLPVKMELSNRQMEPLFAYFHYIYLSADYTESATVEKPASALATQSQSSTSGSGGLNLSSGPPGSSASTVPVSPVLQSSNPLLQDPLLRQLLPALQTAVQLNNASVDMAKINEGKNNSSF